MKDMKRILLSCLFACIGYFSYAQCNNIPVEEAVRNGDFEAGYLPGSTIGAKVNSHTFTSGGQFDFQSDLDYAGEWKGGSSPCLYGIANQYGVGRVELITNPCNGGRDAIVYGQYTSAASYTDHTTGTNKGFSMFVDFNTSSTAFQTVWAQTVDIYASQEYYFSSWFAQYNSGSVGAPTLRFRVEAYDGNGKLIENKSVGSAPISGPGMSWKQFSGKYESPSNAVTAKVIIECRPVGQSNTDDFMLDDISFINSGGCTVTCVPPQISSTQVTSAANCGAERTLSTNFAKKTDSTEYDVIWYSGKGIGGNVLGTGNNFKVSPTVPTYYTVKVNEKGASCYSVDTIYTNNYIKYTTNNIPAVNFLKKEVQLKVTSTSEYAPHIKWDLSKSEGLEIVSQTANSSTSIITLKPTTESKKEISFSINAPNGCKTETTVPFSFYIHEATCNSSTPIKEAVRNGDFEAGYLPGANIGVTTTSHTFTKGGIYDFESDLQYAGKWNGPKSACDYGMANQYGVGRVETITNPGCAGKGIVYGLYTSASRYKDHTIGTDQGFSMFVDFNGVSGFKKVWAQNVDIYPSQKYYFSTWFAQYGGNQSSATLRFRVETYTANGTLIENKIVGNGKIAPPSMTWQQFIGLYESPASAVKAKLFIECQPTGNPSSDDFMIDDISFINNPKNFPNHPVKARFEQKEISVCQNNGEVKLEPIVEGDNNYTYHWSKNESTDKISSASTLTVNTPDNYHVCIENPSTGAITRASITVTKDFSVELSDSIHLCSPSKQLVDTKLDKNFFKHEWTGPNNTSLDQSSILINQKGIYNLDISSDINAICQAQKTVIVTSSLPTVPTNLKYCSKVESEITLSHPDNTKTWKWCEDDACVTEIGVGNDIKYAWTNSGDQTVYLKDNTVDSVGLIGPSDMPDGFSLRTGQEHQTRFDALTGIIIKNVEITNCSFCNGQSVTVYLRDKDNNILQEYTQALTVKGKQKLPINFSVSPGSHILSIKSNNFISTTRFSTSPKTYSIANVINITSYNSGNYEGGLANWEVYKKGACDPVPVTIKEECIVTTTLDGSDNSVQVSPNPFENITTISVNTFSSIVVYDVNGNIVESFDSVNEAIIGQNLTSGIYFVSIQNENGVFHQKIVKQ